MPFTFGLPKVIEDQPKLEAKTLTRADKEELDGEILMAMKQGWRVKMRGHDSDGSHSATLVKPLVAVSDKAAA